MQANLITVVPDTPLLHIQHMFVVAHINGAPVVDERGAVPTALDLLQAVPS